MKIATPKTRPRKHNSQHYHHHKQKNMVPSPRFLASLTLLLFFLDIFSSSPTNPNGNSGQDPPRWAVPIGVVLDLGSPVGSMVNLCMKMAVEDFYAAHSDCRTRLQLHVESADSVVDATFAAVELLNQKQVDGIIGPQESTQETFFAELAEKTHVPTISFSATTSPLPNNRSPYFFRTTPDDAVQSQALAAVFRGFGWSEVAIIYEDTQNGDRFISHLNTALQDAEIRLAYMVPVAISADSGRILRELNRLETKQTRVFLVHMGQSLGHRFFNLAKRASLMSQGYVWLVTYTLSVFMGSADPASRDSMEGVLGVRPHVPRSVALDDFQERWRRHTTAELNVYGLWAYDAVTALAMAVERAAPSHRNSTGLRSNGKDLRSSTFGPRILDHLSSVEFQGLTGDFRLIDGKLRQSPVEIFNVIGTGEKTVGYWTPKGGLVRELSLPGKTNSYSSSAKELKSIMWPGDSINRPKGWAIPKLRVGVPCKLGFTEFVKLVVDNKPNHGLNLTGFSVDIFLATLNLLPFPINYEFSYYNDTGNPNWTYDEMLRQIPREFDMIVGDTTIWAPRATFVDFSLPYSESGVTLVVKNRKPFDMWIFVRPLRWDLWLAIFSACIVMGIVLRILERHATVEESDSLRTHKSRLGIHLSPVAVLAFPERNMVSNNWSILVLVFWLLMAFVLMQSYTANLSAILTVDQLKFAFSDNYFVGYQEGSFMRTFLTEQLHISESRLRSYGSAEEYHKAMSLGSKYGGIDAVMDEIPYLKILINKYDSQYKMVGPTYVTGGFGFAFPLGSPLVAHFSKAILEVTQGPNMTAIQQQNFGPGYSSQDPQSSTISQETSSLSLYDFAGLFIIIASVTAFALFCSETAIGLRLTSQSERLIHRCFFFKAPPRVNPAAEDSSVNGDSTLGVDDATSHEEGLDTHVSEEIRETGATSETLDARDSVTGVESNRERTM